MIQHRYKWCHRDVTVSVTNGFSSPNNTTEDQEWIDVETSLLGTAISINYPCSWL